jgi:uncharacterized membrane protein YhaH (DUF805 family)
LGPVEAITTCLRKSFRFSGRASRTEYWWFFGFTMLLFYSTFAVDVLALEIMAPGEPFEWLSTSGVVTIATLLPILAAGYRRLQDTGLPGAFYVGLTALGYAQIFAQDSTLHLVAMVASGALILLCIRRS